MELVDVYDAQGHPTGAVRERRQPMQEGEYVMAVGVWIADSENHILLTQRSLSKSFAPGKWENTGGHVHAGEDCTAAMVRELQEETGISVSPEELIYLGDSAPTGHYLGKNYGLRLKSHPEQITLQPGETCDAKWVTPEELGWMARTEELAPSVVDHLQGGYLEAFLKFIGREGVNLFGKDEGQ
ncbi:MAG: NUDIX domain-containing protein [Acutalibacter sp.]